MIFAATDVAGLAAVGLAVAGLAIARLAIAVFAAASLAIATFTKRGVLMHKCVRMLSLDEATEINKLAGFDVGAFAYDVFGGFFCLRDTVRYFAPDSLAFEDLRITREAWNNWIATEQADSFYEQWYWDGLDDMLSTLKPGYAISFYPFLWAEECDINSASKQAMPVLEIIGVNLDLMRKLYSE
jgi:hypothetical protein